MFLGSRARPVCLGLRTVSRLSINVIIIVEGVALPGLTQAPRYDRQWRSSSILSTWTVDGDEWLASRPSSRLIRGGTAPGSHRIGGWVSQTLLSTENKSVTFS
jgi:hypothetical protein